MTKRQTKHEQNRVFTLNDPNAPRLCPELAMEIGLNESILFLQLEFWISVGDNERDGRKWTYQSVRDIQQQFPFWSPMTINRAIQQLEKLNLITTANYNDRKADRTRWFAINLIEASQLKSVRVFGVETVVITDEKPDQLPVSNCDSVYQIDRGVYQNDTALNQNDTALPETTTETTTEVTTDGAIAPVPPPVEVSTTPTVVGKVERSDTAGKKKRPAAAPYSWGSVVPIDNPVHAELIKIGLVAVDASDERKESYELLARDYIKNGRTVEQLKAFLGGWFSQKPTTSAYHKRRPSAKEIRDNFDAVLEKLGGKNVGHEQPIRNPNGSYNTRAL